MKKRILSVLLCLMLVVSLLPIQAIASEGSECAQCSHYHFGDYVCSGCGLCSSECSNSDCWYETHCKNCGGCYMSADDWCDECGWCDDCMQEAHCLDCKRCFVGDSKDELCEDCQRCTYCVEDNFVCEECNKCVDCGDDYEHCQSCHKHLEGGEVCGYCDECAMEEGLHCEECGGCFETEVDHCPIHGDDPHCEGCAGDYCEECGECQFTNPDLALCDFCGLCKDCCSEVSMSEGCSTGEVCVEDGEWANHFCSGCGECFCDKDKCSKCDRCTDCCKDADECTGCDCGEATSTAHTHKYDPNKWVIDQTRHWNECRVCHAQLNSAPHEDRDENGQCDTCQCDPTKLLYIKKQPKSVTRKVSDEDLDETDPSHPCNNRAVFSVEARDMVEGRTLSYQWYVIKTDKKTKVVSGPYEMRNSESDYTTGVTTAKLDMGVPLNSCFIKLEYYCEVTATAADGSKDTVYSDRVELRTTHNYSKLTCSDTPQTVTITYNDDEGTSGWETYKQGSVYHNQKCIGVSCGRTKLPEKTPHNFEFLKYLDKGGYQDSSVYDKYFYLMKCADCGYVDLRVATSETNLPWAITLDAPEGSYAADEKTDCKTTSAMPGTRLYAYAPYVSGGKVFKEWKIVGISDAAAASINLQNDPVDIGWCTFTMPNFAIELHAVYDDTKVPVETIRIIEDGTPIKGHAITVKKGATFTVKSILNPSTNIVDDRVQWCILGYNVTSPQVVFDSSCADIVLNTLSNPMTGPVKLVAKEVGTVHLRATAYASVRGGEQVSDYVRINVVAADEHITHDYEEKSTTPPTCTQQGYTLYECKGKGCDRVYKTNIIDPTGHKDGNGDGLCDACGLKMGVTGRTKIKLVKLSVTAPAKDVKPAAITSVDPRRAEITSADERYTVANVQWMTEGGQALDPNDTFAPGTVYTVKVVLEAKDGYAFQMKGFTKKKLLEPASVSKATDFQINEVSVTPGNGSSSEIVNLIYTFAATEGAHIHSLTKVDASPATCTENGTIEHYQCGGCGKLFADAAGTKEIAADKTIDPATGHDYEWKIDKEPTATEKGSKHEECKNCGDTKTAAEIPATGKPTDPEKPTDPTDPSDPTNSEKPTKPEDSKSPKTGDNSMMGLWFALLFVSGGVVTGATLYSRKKKCEE